MLRAVNASASQSVRKIRRRRGGDDLGSSTVEFVVAAALMMMLLLVIAQIGVYFHLRAVAQTAARHGVDQVRVYDGSVEAGIATTEEFLDQSGGSIKDRHVTASRTAAQSSVNVSGALVSVIPGLRLHFDVTVDAPTERTTP